MGKKRTSRRAPRPPQQHDAAFKDGPAAEPEPAPVLAVHARPSRRARAASRCQRTPCGPWRTPGRSRAARQRRLHRGSSRRRSHDLRTMLALQRSGSGSSATSSSSSFVSFDGERMPTSAALAWRRFWCATRRWWSRQRLLYTSTAARISAESRLGCEESAGDARWTPRDDGSGAHARALRYADAAASPNAATALPRRPSECSAADARGVKNATAGMDDSAGYVLAAAASAQPLPARAHHSRTSCRRCRPGCQTLMLSMGLSLTPADLRRALASPREIARSRWRRAPRFGAMTLLSRRLRARAIALSTTAAGLVLLGGRERRPGEFNQVRAARRRRPRVECSRRTAEHDGPRRCRDAGARPTAARRDGRGRCAAMLGSIARLVLCHSPPASPPAQYLIQRCASRRLQPALPRLGIAALLGLVAGGSANAASLLLGAAAPAGARRLHPAATHWRRRRARHRRRRAPRRGALRARSRSRRRVKSPTLAGADDRADALRERRRRRRPRRLDGVARGGRRRRREERVAPPRSQVRRSSNRHSRPLTALPWQKAAGDGIPRPRTSAFAEVNSQFAENELSAYTPSFAAAYAA